MKTRLYGKGPIRIALIHGGPGAPGYMAPVCRELSKSFGVMEPLQTQKSLDGQLEELDRQLAQYAPGPITILGSSWGATLALLYAAQFKGKVSQVILSGSCVYDAASSSVVKAIRFERMQPDIREELEKLMKSFEVCPIEQRNSLFAQAADCYFGPDTYDPLTRDLEVIECQHDINQFVWADFKKIRDNGDELRNIFCKIDVPVLNIHGSFDPHIIAGIQPFLESCISDIELITLEECGHYPWIEKSAKEEFYKIIRSQISN